MRALASGLIAMAVGLSSWPAHGHHSFAVHFSPEPSVTITGVVTEFRFHNPHGLIFLDVEDDDGKPRQWRVETNSPSILRRRGWSADAIRPGDRVSIDGYPARDRSNYLRVAHLRFDDGRELIGQRPSEAAGDGRD